MPRTRVPSRSELERVFGRNQDLIKQFELLFSEGDDFSSEILALQNLTTAILTELNTAETGAGLNANGTYNTPSGTNYLDSTTSIQNAVETLDGAIGSQKIVVKTTNYSVTEENQLIIANATSGAINITMPPPANCFSNSCSLTITITKSDITSNKVNILPNASETIVGETSQYLQSEGEILTFITDGSNWHLGG